MSVTTEADNRLEEIKVHLKQSRDILVKVLYGDISLAAYSDGYILRIEKSLSLVNKALKTL